MRLPVAAIVALATLAAAGSAAAQAAAPASDAPVSTASAVSSFPNTQAQIEQYLASSPVARTPVDRFYGDGPLEAVDEDGQRKIHGEVSVSVGTGGYRSGAMSAVIPLGERGSLGIAFSKTDFGTTGGYYPYDGFGYGRPGYGYGYGYGYDDGPSFGGYSVTTKCRVSSWGDGREDMAPVGRRMRSGSEDCLAR